MLGNIKTFVRPSTLAFAALGALFFIANWHVLTIGFLPTDDHEIVMMSHDPWAAWLHSEVFQPSSRWRPSYYSLRALEVVAWGNAPVLWHIARLIAVGSAVAMFSASAAALMGPATGLLFGIALVFAPVLYGFSSILGPAETYCFLGLAIWSLGCTGLLQTIQSTHDPASLSRTKTWLSVPCHSNINAGLIFFGSIIAAGSKENLIILLLPNLWLLWKSAQAGASKDYGSKVSTFLLALACFSLVPLFIFLLRLSLTSGKDIYENSLSPGSAELLYVTIKSLHKLGALLVSVSVATVLIRINRTGLDALARVMIFLSLMCVWSPLFNRQVIRFYDSHRYAMMHQIALLALFFCLVSLWTGDLGRWGFKIRKGLFACIAIPILAGGGSLVHKNFLESEWLSTKSKHWLEYLTRINQAHQVNTSPVAIISTHWLNTFEAATSTARFLQYYFKVDPRQVAIFYFPDRESQLRSKDRFQVMLEESIRNPERTYGPKHQTTPWSKALEQQLMDSKLSNLNDVSPSVPPIICAFPAKSMEIMSSLSSVCNRIIAQENE